MKGEAQDGPGTEVQSRLGMERFGFPVLRQYAAEKPAQA